MSLIRLHILFLSLLIGGGLIARSNNDSVFKGTVVCSFYLKKTSDSKNILLKESTKRLHLFIFLSPECPLCKRYSPLLKRLYGEYQQDVEFYGIVPGKAYTTADVKSYVEENDIPFTTLIDYKKELSNYLQATITPEVILLNDNYKLIYKGAIDNLFIQLGKQRTKATENFLSDAIYKGLHNQSIAVKRTKTVGCRINDY